MIKQRMLLLGIVCITMLPILLLSLYSYRTASQYIEYPPPKITADSIKSLIITLIQREEYFMGSVNVKFVDISHSSDLNKAEIIMKNESSGDDSLGATEYKILAEKKDQMWIITQYKIHWKCARDFPFVFWTIKTCS